MTNLQINQSIRNQKFELYNILSVYGGIIAKTVKGLSNDQKTTVNKDLIIKHFDKYFKVLNNDKAKAFVSYYDVIDSSKEILKRGGIEAINSYRELYELTDEQEDSLFRFYNDITRLVLKEVKEKNFERVTVNGLKIYYSSIANKDSKVSKEEGYKAFVESIQMLLGIDEPKAKEIANKMEVNAIQINKVKSEWGVMKTLHSIVKTILVKHGQYSKKKSILEYKNIMKDVTIIREFEYNTSTVLSKCTEFGIVINPKDFDYRVAKRAVQKYIRNNCVVLPSCLFAENLALKEQPKEEPKTEEPKTEEVKTEEPKETKEEPKETK